VLCHGTRAEVLSHAEARAKYFGDGIDLPSPGPPPPHATRTSAPAAAPAASPRRKRTDVG